MTPYFEAIISEALTLILSKNDPYYILTKSFMRFEMISERVTYSPVPINGVVSLGSSTAPFLDEGEVLETIPGGPPSL